MSSENSAKRYSKSSVRNRAAAGGWSGARRYPASHRVSGRGRKSGSAGAGRARARRVRCVVLQRRPDPPGGIVVRAVPGAVQPLRPGMLPQAGGDRPGVADGPLSQITAITGARGKARGSWSGNAVKPAARRRPGRQIQVPAVTSIAPDTVTCRLPPWVISAAGSRAGSSWPGHGAAGAGGFRLRPAAPAGTAPGGRAAPRSRRRILGSCRSRSLDCWRAR